MLDTGVNVHLRIEQVKGTVLATGRRHHLHQTASTSRRYGAAVVCRLHFAESADHSGIEPMPGRRRGDEREKWLRNRLLQPERRVDLIRRKRNLGNLVRIF